MLKTVFVVLAAAWLGACASAPGSTVAAVALAASFDDAAPVDAAVAPAPERKDVECADDIAVGGSGAAPASSYAGLERRLFSPPSRRQPDQRLIAATALDRSRRHARLRRRRSHA